MDDQKEKIKKLVFEYVGSKTKHNFIPGETNIPPSGKVIDHNEVWNIIDSALDMWLTTGRFNNEFENKLAKFIGIKKLITVNSGSSANLVAFTSLTSSTLGEKAIQKGDEVITVAAGFPTTVNPIIQNGCIPVFVDIDPKTHNINPNLIEEAISNKTKAIMIAHSLGNPFELERVVKICQEHNLWLIEDCCDALGSKYNNQNVGTFGHIATLSFYPAHHITMGEGGAVFSNDKKLMKIAESIRDWGRDCYCPPGEDNTCKKRFDWQLGGLPHGYDHKYTYSNIGYNLKASDMQAAIGASQIEKIPDFIKARIRNFEYLYEKFTDFEVFDLPKWDSKAEPSWFGFPLTINNKANFKRLDLLKFYDERNIGTRLLFAGNILLQPAYMDLKLGKPEDFPVANNVSENTFWLGVFPGLTKEMLDFVVNSTREFLDHN